MIDLRGKQWVNVSLAGGVGLLLLRCLLSESLCRQPRPWQGLPGPRKPWRVSRPRHGQGQPRQGQRLHGRPPGGRRRLLRGRDGCKVFSSPRARGWLVACKSCWRWLVRRRRRENIRWQIHVLNMFGYCFGIEETITWFKLKRHQRVISENYIFLPLVSQPLSSRPWRQGS